MARIESQEEARVRAAREAEQRVKVKTADEAADEARFGPPADYVAKEAAAKARAGEVTTPGTTPYPYDNVARKAEADRAAEVKKVAAYENEGGATNTNLFLASEKGKSDFASRGNTSGPRQSNEWMGAEFRLADTNGDGMPDAIVVVPITPKMAQRTVDESKFAAYHAAMTAARAQASLENRGRPTREVEAAVNVAVNKAKAAYTGPVPPVDTAAVAKAEAKAKEVAADKVAFEAELKKLS